MSNINNEEVKKIYELFENLSDAGKVELLNLIDADKLRILDAWNEEQEKARQNLKRQLSPYNKLLFEFMRNAGEI